MDRKPVLRGKAVILIDDVLTTGATVEACTRVLRAGGAAEVHVLTLARVVPASRVKRSCLCVWCGKIVTDNISKRQLGLS